MARIRISIPENFSFTTIIPIRITDLNYGGHVGNDAILSLLHEARVQFLKQHGFTELDFASTSLIMSDVAIEYKAEVFYGSSLKVMVTAADFTRAGFDIFYKVVGAENEQLIAIAKTGMVCFDYNTKKITAVPQQVLDSLKAPS
jgi:YbgC/YbaW family acyl-CoA thioester hydrolase